MPAAALGVRERRAQLLARADAELREHLVQVVLDGARADEQLGADLRVRLPVDGEPGDLRLLRGEQVARLDREPAHRLAGGRQLAPGTLGEPLGADAAERLVGGAKLLARVDAPASRDAATRRRASWARATWTTPRLRSSRSIASR